MYGMPSQTQPGAVLPPDVFGGLIVNANMSDCIIQVLLKGHDFTHAGALFRQWETVV